MTHPKRAMQSKGFRGLADSAHESRLWVLSALGAPATQHMSEPVKRTVAACESQFVTAEGLCFLLDRCPDFEFVGAADSPGATLELVRKHSPALLILDKSFGAQAVMEILGVLQACEPSPAVIVWGLSVTEGEALRFMQAGARGIMRRSAPLETVLACLRAVGAGQTWMEPSVTPAQARLARSSGPALTSRERQVLELVAQGLKNREIGHELGIRPGTVKVHLKHIFEKTGVRGRFGLALAGLE